MTAVTPGRSRGLTVVVTALVLVLMSRGVLELTIGKTPAYAVQALAAVLVVAIVLVSGRAYLAPNGSRVWLAYYVFALAAVTSGVLTLAISRTERALPYIAVMLFITALMTAVSSTRRRQVRVDFAAVVAVALMCLVGVAVLQQFGGFSLLPGNDRGTFAGGAVRPASLTGSYLHYPLCTALLGFAAAGLAHARRSRFLAVLATVGLLAVVISYSRSGMLIVGAGAVLAAVFAPGTGSKLRLLYLGIVAAIVVHLGFSGTTVVDRALSAFSPESAGNVTRLARWGHAVRMWLDSPMLLGRYTGEVTNVTGNLTSARAVVVESGTLQQLLNFGVIGTVAFYAVAVFSVRAVARSAWLVRAGMTAALVQTFVYQSVEVLPFMALFAFLPAVMDSPPDEPPAPPREGALQVRPATADRASAVRLVG